MNSKKILTDKNTLCDYHINAHKIDENKLISKDKISKHRLRKFYKINENYYLKLPLFKIKTLKIIAATMAGVLVVGTGATVTVLYAPHKVSLSSENLEISKSTNACLAYDYKCTFKIKDDKITDNYMKNIKINSVKCNGKEIPIEDYSFVYQTNAKNELTINKKHLGGKIEIDADLVNKQSKQHNCFWFEFNIAEYANFKDAKITVPNNDSIYITKEMTQAQFLPLFIKGFDLDNEHFNIVDNPLLNDGVNLVLIDKSTYSIEIGGQTISFSTPFDMIFVREDNAIKYDIKAKPGMTLPKNLWLRSNARFTKKNEDFYLTFLNNYTEATIEIPYYFIRDNGSIAVNPEVEG